MSDPLDFIDSYHNDGTVHRRYRQPSRAERMESTPDWQVEAAECKFCRHNWHGLQCLLQDCGCATSCDNLCMSQSEEHLIRGID